MSRYRHPAPSQALVRSWLRHRDAATVDLDTSYELCRRLNAAHGRTYYFATRFLPPGRRRHVHALYGFARYADDLVDHLDLPWDAAQRGRALDAWAEEMSRCIAGGDTDDPVLKAAVHTIATLDIRHDDVRAFLRSMAMDAHVTRYPTWAELSEYVHGSAAVIGSMLLPVLGARDPRARDRAMDLGVAFQLTNFLRDIGEDWDRGRIYLPLEDLDRFRVSEADFRARRVGPAFRRLLAFEAARARALYRRAEEGWSMLPPASRPCVRIAHRLYAQILDRIEAADYQVFAVRAAVPAGRKAAVAARELVLPSRPRLRRSDDRADGPARRVVPPWTREGSGVRARPATATKASDVQPFTNPSRPAAEPAGQASPAARADVVVELDHLRPVMARRSIDLLTERAFHVTDVTDECVDLVTASGVQQGTLTVFTRHTTCAVKINEPEMCFLEDFRLFMENLVPADAYYRHDDFEIRDPRTLEGSVEDEPVNGHSHIKQMLLGCASEAVPVATGELVLGRWQRIMFIELDQARPRRIELQVQGWR